MGVRGGLLLWAWLGSAGSAAAHHAPGHAASEGVRYLNSLGGGSGRATSRLMVLQEFSDLRTGLRPSTTYSTSVLGEYAPHPWVSLGIQAPLLVVDEHASGVPTKVGYGDTRAFFRLSPRADALVRRTVTVGVDASFPTRTIRFETDPGRTWSVTPLVLFTRTYQGPFWQVMALGTMETRPAGTALEVGGAGQAGYRAGRVTPAYGFLTVVRVANFCREASGGSSFCTGNRSTERERAVGSVRVAQVLTLSVRAADWALLAGSIVLPMTQTRDADVSGSLSVQFFF